VKIEIQHIPSHGLTMNHHVQAVEFDILKILVDNGEAEFIAPIAVNLSIVPIRDLIQIEGSVQTSVRLDCSRCLTSFESFLQKKFTLSYSRKIPQDLQEGETDEVELTAEQIGLISFQGDEIDLHSALAEQVVLVLPYKPLCRNDCKGLCPSCGTNLNQETCGCDAQATGGPFDALKALKLPPSNR
jgi:uncharacterized protein